MNIRNWCVLGALLLALSGEVMTEINQQIVAEYTDQYCLGLEAAYGDNMMSDGGAVAIDKLFANIPIAKKVAVDIGSGIGGVAFHLAKNYGTQVTGVEINPWMVQESTRRIPEASKDLLKFVLLEKDDHLPFADSSIDVVYSKGVLVHIQNKEPLFREIMRILKPGGILLVNDWLAPHEGAWGASMQKLIALESLILFPTIPATYSAVLTKVGFQNISVTNVTSEYSAYNRAIVTHLESLPQDKKELLSKQFGETFIPDAASGYRFITDAMDASELFCQNIFATKP